MLGLLPLVELLFERIWLRIIALIHHFGNLVVPKLMGRFLAVKLLRVVGFAFLVGTGKMGVEPGDFSCLLLVLGRI